MAVAYRIRPALLADVAELARLEPRCFSDPWSPGGFREMLESPHSFGLLAELKSGQLGGYLVARAVEREGEILNLAVVPERRRHGLGGGLLEAGLDALKSRGVNDVFLEVRASNEPAIAMYLARGFRPMGRRREYYRKPVEDAMVLRKSLE
ncbi:MAG: ribosomal protein S18-alanine N-acetyltransferase [Gemmatimonadota bacterium]